MTPQQLMDGLAEKNRLLTAKNTELKKLAEIAAEKKKEHKILFRQKMLELKKNNPTTILIKLCEGDKMVAQAMFEADVADAVYKACRDSIEDVRKGIDTYITMLSWEKQERFSRNV